MRLLSYSVCLVAASALVQAAQSPFFYSDQSNSKYAKTGKMVQEGHTGVAAMHAVLLK
jgi:hypothetical protein